MPDFTRINLPRVEKITALILTIRKSARSQKISDKDVAEMLAPVASLACGPTTAEVTTIITPPSVDADTPPAKALPKARPIWRDPPHIEQIAGFVAALPNEQIPSYITHLVNRLCEQAEQNQSAA